jgi:hypothetical protein
MVGRTLAIEQPSFVSLFVGWHEGIGSTISTKNNENSVMIASRKSSMRFTERRTI